MKQQVSVLLRKFDVASRAVLARDAVTMRLLGRASPEDVPYEYLFDRAPVLIAMSRGPEHELTLVNGAFVSLFGDRPYVGRTVRECFPASGAGLLKEFDRIIQSGASLERSEQRLLFQPPHSAEREVYLSLVAEPTRAPSGEITGIVFYAWDVTEQVAVRQRLQRLTAEQEVLLQQLPVGVVYIDAQARPAMVNPVARRILGGGFDPSRPLYAQLDRWNVRLTSSGASLTPANAPSALAMRGRPFDEEVTVRAGDGRDLRLHVSTRPLHDERGVVTGAVIILSERDQVVERVPARQS